MDEVAINSALNNIYHNLKKLESAREQVNNLSQKSESIIEEFLSVSENLKSLEKAIHFQDKEIERKIEFSLNSLKKQIEKSNSNLIKSTDSYQSDLSSYSKALGKHVDRSIKQIDDFLITRLNKEDFISKIDLSFEKFDAELEVIVTGVAENGKVFKSGLEDNLTKLERSIEDSINHIKNYLEVFQKVENRIYNSDLLKVANAMNLSISSLKNQIETNNFETEQKLQLLEVGLKKQIRIHSAISSFVIILVFLISQLF